MNKKGFTLIELLAVIIILAIVALLATPIILNVVEDAKKSVGQSEANMILTGINTYCEQEKMGIAKTDYCQSGETIKQNIDKMVNLGKVNKDSINITLDSDKIDFMVIKSNDYDYVFCNDKFVKNIDECGTIPPKVSISIYQKDNILYMKGQIDDYEHKYKYYNIVSKGMLLINKGRMRGQYLTINTYGRSNAVFENQVMEDGTFTFKFEKVSATSTYVMRAYAVYLDKNTGKEIYVYSDMITTSLHTAPELN